MFVGGSKLMRCFCCRISLSLHTVSGGRLTLICVDHESSLGRVIVLWLLTLI